MLTTPRRAGWRSLPALSLPLVLVLVLSACGATPPPGGSVFPTAGPSAALPIPTATTAPRASATQAPPGASNASQPHTPGGGQTPAQPTLGTPAMPDMHGGAGASAPPTPAARPNTGNVAYTPSVAFTLKTFIGDGKLVFVGVGGSIDGVKNPTLQVKPGDTVQITLINDDGAEHDITLPDFGVISERVIKKGASSTIVFNTEKEGEFVYFCTIPGHRQAGMEGKLVVGAGGVAPAAAGADIVRQPADLPKTVGQRDPQVVRVDLETVELEGKLANGISYQYWTFNSKVPGPFVRVRQDDTVEVHLKNDATSRMTHSVDFHATTGPGGGATVMQVPPGQEKVFTFKALNVGLYVYHCATPMVSQHIASGMYGLILVEPKGGLPPVDHEFYVMQGEIYTHGAFNQQGRQEFDVQKNLNEQPEYFVLNGAVGALTDQHPLQAKVGETVRIYFGVGGPNYTSSFHVIGEIFDKVFDQATLTATPHTDVQTTLVPPGGATMVEIKLQYPGRYILVDHALSRVERGLAGFLDVEGPADPAIYKEGPAQ